MKGTRHTAHCVRLGEAQLAQIEKVVKESTMSCLRAMLELKDLDMPTHFLFLPYDDALAQSGGHEVVLAFLFPFPSIYSSFSRTHTHERALHAHTFTDNTHSYAYV